MHLDSGTDLDGFIGRSRLVRGAVCGRDIAQRTLFNLGGQQKLDEQIAVDFNRRVEGSDSEIEEPVCVTVCRVFIFKVTGPRPLRG